VAEIEHASPGRCILAAHRCPHHACRRPDTSMAIEQMDQAEYIISLQPQLALSTCPIIKLLPGVHLPAHQGLKSSQGRTSPILLRL